jgi:hypothetical protein
VKTAISLLFLFATQVMAASAEQPIDPGDDFSPMLAVFALIAILIALFLIGVGIFVAAAVAASLAVLAGLGIVSSAVLVGLVKRRFTSGLRALHYQVFALLAVPAGIGVLWLGSYLMQSQLSLTEILTIGSVAGIGGGLALAFLLDRLAGLIYRRFTHLAESAQSSAK